MSKLKLKCLPALLLFLAYSSNVSGQMNELRSAILAKINAFPEATVAVAYMNLTTNETLLINEKAMMHAASTMKVPVMIEVFKQAAAGKFKLTDSLLVKNEFKSIVDSSLYSMDIGEDSDESIYDQIGKKMSIYDLTYQMITVSSNLATNILIDLVDAKSVMQTMKEIGAHDIRVLRGVEDIKAYHTGLNNATDAYDMLLVMQAIANNRVVNGSACEKMIAILLAQKFNDKIPALLPKDVQVAHKTGWITGINHDCAIVYPPKAAPYILVILTKGIADKKQSDRLIADISKMIFHKH